MPSRTLQSCLLSTSRQPCARGITRRGFTLIELIVGSIVAAIITAATATSLYNLFEARKSADDRRTAFVAARSATERIARDISTIARDHDLAFSTVRVTNIEANGVSYDELLLLCTSADPVRGLESAPEGDRFEVQYRLNGDGSLLRRRDPAFDPFIDAGGVVTTVADHIKSFKVEASDGKEWFTSWDSDRDGLPHGVRIVITATLREGGEVFARRTIAIDRVPIPIDENAAEETPEGQTPPSATSTTTNSTRTTGGGGGGGGSGGGGGARPTPNPTPSPTPAPTPATPSSGPDSGNSPRTGGGGTAGGPR